MKDDPDNRISTAGQHRERAETTEVANALYAGHYTVDLDHPLTETEANELLGKPGDVSVDPMVMQSLRVPTEIVLGARALARQRGVKVSVLFREWLAAGYVAASETTPPVVEMRLVRDYLDELIRREQAA